MTFLRFSSRIRTSPLHAEDAPLAVDAHRSRPTSLSDENRKFVVLIQHAHGAGLFLRKQKSPLFGSSNSIGVVGALTDELPFGTCGNYAGDGGDRHLFSRSRLREVPRSSSVSLLSDRGRR